jgi:hypothetical protein
MKIFNLKLLNIKFIFLIKYFKKWFSFSSTLIKEWEPSIVFVDRPFLKFNKNKLNINNWKRVYIKFILYKIMNFVLFFESTIIVKEWRFGCPASEIGTVWIENITSTKTFKLNQMLIHQNMKNLIIKMQILFQWNSKQKLSIKNCVRIINK